MAHYGQLLDAGYDPTKDNLYKLFAQYFNNPIMTKLKNVNGYSMYIAKIYALLGIKHRYIIVFIPEDNHSIGTQEYLENLHWSSLQTRTLTEEHLLSPHTYIPSRFPALNKKITLIKYDKKQYVYSVEDLPLIVTLLPSDKSKGIEYNSSGSLVAALETFQTIVSYQT